MLKEPYRPYAALVVAALAVIAAIIMYLRYRRARTALNRISDHMKQVAEDVAAEKAQKSEMVEAEPMGDEPLGENLGTVETSRYIAPVMMPGLHFRIQLLPPGPLGQSRLNAWRNDNMARVEVVCDTTGTFTGDGTQPFSAWVFRLFGHDGVQQKETYVPITADGPDDHRIVSEIRALLAVKQIIT